MVGSVTRPARPVPRRSSRFTPWRAPAIAGLLTTGVAITGTTASFSGDELATYNAATRSLDALWELAKHIDGHFLPYYLFMHLWTLLGGHAEWWMRLPSAIGVGIAAALLTDLGRRLHGTAAGLCAAAIFAVLPSVSFHGANARPYAFAAAAAALSAWALHRVLERPTRGRLAGYAGAVALLGCTHLFSALVLPAQVLAALCHRVPLLRFLPALAAGCVPMAVLGVIGYQERHAISWIQPAEPEILLRYPKMLTGSVPVGWALLLLAVAGLAVLWRRGRAGAVLVAGWLLLPPPLLLTISALITPAYVDRYLFPAAPALALAAGIAVASLGRLAVPVIVIVAALGLPTQADYRQRNGHYDDFPGAVQVIKDRARPGDAIIYGQSRLRTGFGYYADGPLPDDVLRVGTAPSATGFGYPERSDVAAALAGRRRVWVVWRGTKEEGLSGSKIPVIEKVRDAGFRLAFAWHSAELPGLTVTLFTR